MTKTIEIKIADLKARAKRVGKNGAKPSSAIRNGSSLHKVIKTKKQASDFMKLLKSS